MSTARADERTLAAWVSALARGSAPDPAAIDAAFLPTLLANRLGPAADLALARDPSPSALGAVVRADAHATAEQGIAALSALRDIAAALDGRGLPWLLWKGPALAMQVWDEPLRRRSADLDIVVRPRDRDAALDALESAGWRLRGDMPRAVARAVHGASRAFPLDREGAPLVELHWGFAGATYPDVARVDDVLTRAESVTIGGRTLRTPGGTDALLLLAMHATKHGWSQAEEVVSFARLAARDAAALPGARAAAQAVGVPRVIALAELLAHRLAGAAAPAFSDPLEAAAVAEMADASIARMLAGDGAWRRTNGWTRRWIARGADRLRFELGIVWRPTPQEWDWLPLPAALAWSYPAVRVVRLALRAAGFVRA